MCVCVWEGGYYEPTERRPIGLSRLPALNNGRVRGKKEGRAKKCSLLGQAVVLHSRQDESRTIKNA